jgi:hypothetical protein
MFGLPNGYSQFTILIENQFLAFLANYGILGLGIFILFLTTGLYSAISAKSPNARKGLLLIWSLLGIFSWTLETLLCVQFIGIIAAVEAIFLAEDRIYMSLPRRSNSNSELYSSTSERSTPII